MKRPESLKAKSLVVMVITLLTMIVEIYFGIVTNSMALTADGFHMGTHALAFGVTFIVCLLSNRFINKANDIDFTGGKINAVILFFSALGIIYESVERFFTPKHISFSEAILISVIGLVINIACLFVIHENHEHAQNLNYKSAYFHILADALTSILAIFALIVGKYYDCTWLDSTMGIIGGILILRWAYLLLIMKKDDNAEY